MPQVQGGECVANTRSARRPAVTDTTAADPGQIRATIDVMTELAQVNKQVAQSARELQAIFDATDTAKGVEALERWVQAVDKVATWVRGNTDVFPLMLALIQAINGGREAPP